MDAVIYLLSALLALAVILLVLFADRARRALGSADQAEVAASSARQAEAEAQAELAAVRAETDALGQAALDALMVLDNRRHIVWANDAVWLLLGNSEPALGQTFIMAVQDAELNQAVLDAMDEHRPIVRQVAIDGATLRIRAVPIAATGGAAVAIEDVTELQRLGRARRDLIANISHELRTPLANIDLAAQTIRSGPPDPELSRRMLDQIDSQVHTLSQLSQEMMDLAQIESGRVILKLTPGRLADVVQRVMELLAPQADAKSLHLNVDVPADLSALMDEQQVGRVLTNIVHNAIKFGPVGSRICVTAEPLDEDVRLCVEDEGPGIPESERARVFERFYKQDRARSKGGTGLGLAIARHIVEGHGGRIWIESRPGPGASFCFTLPRA